MIDNTSQNAMLHRLRGGVCVIVYFQFYVLKISESKYLKVYTSLRF